LDPGGDSGVEDVEGQCAGVNDLIVEGAEIEFWPQCFFGAGAEFEDFELTQLVAESLRGPRDVAIALGVDGGVVETGVGVEVVDHLLAGPVLGVDAGVDDEANATEDVGFKAAEVGVRILIEADVFAEVLRVESPAFGVGGVVEVFAELRQAGEFLGDGDLQVMARQALVVGDGFNVGEGAVLEVVRVDEDGAGARSVGRALLVISGGLIFFHEGGTASTVSGALGKRPKSSGSLGRILSMSAR
jgi:hypothetical protein